jgi:hypothetical protein
MTNPFAVNPGGVVQGIGPGPIMGQGIADVLAQMQIGKENQFRQQELQNQMMQQQALQQYYQAQAQAEQQRIAAEAQENIYKREGLAQQGRAVQNFMGAQGQPGVFQPGAAPMGGGGMPQQPGNFTQAGMSSAMTTPGNIFRDTLQGGAAAIGGQPGYNRIFEGVAPENIPGALEALQNAQSLLPQAPEAPELPTTAKEYLFLQQLSPEQRAQYWKMVGPKPGSVTNVNVGGQPTPFSEEFDKGAAKGTMSATDAAGEAFRSLAVVDEAHRLLSKGNVLTGFFAKPALSAYRMAASLGVPDAKLKTADTQTMLKLAGEATFTYLRSRDLGSGTAVSDGDREFAYTLSGRDLTQDKVALLRTLRINYGTGLMKQGDAMATLAKRAQQFPERAPQISQDVADIQNKYDFSWGTYARMLKQEGVTAGEIMEKMTFSRVSPSAIAKIMKDIEKVQSTEAGISVNDAMKTLRQGVMNGPQ